MAVNPISLLGTLVTWTKLILIPVVKDPAGTPITEKAALSSFFSNGTWVVPAQEISLPAADFTLTNGNSAQSAFPTTGDVMTVTANTMYHIKGQYFIGTGATTHTTGMLFALSGATLNYIYYISSAHSAALLGVAAAQKKRNNAATIMIVTATSTAVECIIEFEGHIKVTNAGTITPQIQFSAAPGTTCVMRQGSWIRFTPIGSDSFTKSGGWA